VFSIGVDLGQRQDYSAVAVVERTEHRIYRTDYLHWMGREEAAPDEWVVRHLERMPLGTAYTAVTARVVELAQHRALAGNCRLVVDATGVGMPVVDMLRASRPGCEIAAVLITGGQGERFDGKVWHVPKLDLLARLQGLLEQKRLRISRRMRESGTLVRELTDMRSTRRASGRLRVGADGSGEHDDLALAVALAVWMGRKGKVGEQRRRLPGI
jgi:hypothetical protein